MRAMVLDRPGQPLTPVERRVPEPRAGEVLIRISACGVCRTDLHIVDGELAEPKLPLVPGHEAVGRIERLGAGVGGLAEGERVGMPWLGWTCGTCRYCRAGRENLCPDAAFNGYTRDGGYADYALADARYCFPVRGDLVDAEAAPLLCAGLIGYRSLRMAGDAEAIGLYGFGAAAHIVAQVAAHQGRQIFAFVRRGDEAARAFALSLGVVWAGWSDEPAPEPLDAAILYAPVGALVPAALRAVAPGGIVVCAGIHMSDLPPFPYSLLWQERRLVSVANLTRRDGVEFLPLAAEIPIRPRVATMPLAEANAGLAALRNGAVSGAIVLTT
ncbi:MAG: zinc-dependent alcohol dehydrogenase family protein [Defluviicoccus sp.]|nr:zinc-dependent alcohol dehydrogenase family protein [Defluviicoccus sp.]MDE0384672.1 zinc-dependent alcohol dehydrogenase family protein [Defluviicoccus sp.]